MRTEAPAAPLHHRRASAPRPRARSLSVLLAAAMAIGAFFALAAPALAAAPAFTGETITEANSAPLGTPWGMAFDSAGNLFLADASGKVIDKYDSSNAFSTQIVDPTHLSEPYIRSVAVNDSTGVVYVGDSEPEKVVVYKPEAGGYAFLEEKSTPGGYIYAAVDNSGGANGGDVYVISAFSGTQHVLRFATNPTTGALEASTEPLTPPGTGFALVASGGEGGLTVDGRNGNVYIAEPGHGKVAVYSAAGTREAELSGPAGFEPIDVAVDETSGQVYAVDKTSKHVDVYAEAATTPEGELEVEGGGSPFAFTAPLGVAVQNGAVATQGQVYVSDGAVVDVFGAAGPPPVTQPLTLKKAGGGEGTVTSSPSGINCGPACAEETHQFTEGSTVTLTETAEAGSTFAGWTGCAAEPSASECEVEMSAAEEVTATFNEVVLAEFPVNASVTGEGEVTGTAIACTAGGGTCSEERKETQTVTLQAAPQTGNHFVGWTGIACNGGNATTTCAFTMPSATVNVAAQFAPTTSAPLTVVLTGNGTVESNPAGITCTSPAEESCTEEFEGTVTLTATEATGYTFAGWLGCKHVTAKTCTVNVTAATEVTAVFLEKGAQGSPGTPGETPTITTLPVGNVHCPNGGLEVTLGASHTFLCNGTNGSNGSNGSNGTNGATGPQGPAGAAGKDGAQGPAGATGPQGPAGPAAKVTCKVKQKGKSKVKVTCTVKQGASASRARLGWRLSRNGHTVRHGLTDRGSSRLDLGGLAAGRYLLHVKGHRNTVIVVS